jgi:hypothetical protein
MQKHPFSRVSMTLIPLVLIPFGAFKPAQADAVREVGRQQCGGGSSRTPSLAPDCQDPSAYRNPGNPSHNCLLDQNGNDAVIDIKTIPLRDAGGRIVGQMSLRYSSSCQTNWVRITSSAGDTVRGSISVRRELESELAPHVMNDFTLPGYGSFYSDMMYAPNMPVLAVVKLTQSYPGGGTRFLDNCIDQGNSRRDGVCGNGGFD